MNSKRKPVTVNRRLFWVILSSLTVLAIWTIVARILAREIILPTPGATVVYLIEMLRKKQTWLALGATVSRALFSFLLNVIAALLTGVISGFVSRIAFVLEPIIAVMKSLPTMGVILLSLIWFKSNTAVIFVCTLIVFPVLYTAVLTGIRHLDSRLMEMHQVFRISWIRTLRHFILPSLRPHLISGMMAGTGLTMKVAVAAEVLSQPAMGIGTILQIERARLNTAGVFSWSLLVILLTVGIDLFFSILRKHMDNQHDQA